MDEPTSRRLPGGLPDIGRSPFGSGSAAGTVTCRPCPDARPSGGHRIGLHRTHGARVTPDEIELGWSWIAHADGFLSAPTL